MEWFDFCIIRVKNCKVEDHQFLWNLQSSFAELPSLCRLQVPCINWSWKWGSQSTVSACPLVWIRWEKLKEIKLKILAYFSWMCCVVAEFVYMLRPDFLYSLVYDNFFQRLNVGGWNKNKNKMSQNKDITWSNDKLSLQKCILLSLVLEPGSFKIKLYNDAFNLLKI